LGVAARGVTAYVFRQILKDDVLARLLHPAIYRAYKDTTVFLDVPPTAASVSLEFAHAAVRIGHQMLRPEYKFNALKSSLHDLEEVFAFKSLGLTVPPDKIVYPLKPKWVIDWSLFFDRCNDATNSENFNWSTKIGLHGTFFVGNNDSFPGPYRGNDFQKRPAGLVFRDFVRGSASRLNSLGALAEAIGQAVVETKPEIADALKAFLDDENRKNFLVETLSWLDENTSVPINPTDTNDSKEQVINRIAENPPILLYLLAESQFDKYEGGKLGVVGSLVFAETFFPAINGRSTETEKRKCSWEQNVKSWAVSVFESEDKIPRTMKDFLEIIERDNPEALRIPGVPSQCEPPENQRDQLS
ncbi:MAG: hypothetical protein AAF870_05245, partial [Pseudomonadota bacterium]